MQQSPHPVEAHRIDVLFPAMRQILRAIGSQTKALRMKAVRQITLSLLVLAAGLYVWIANVPAARSMMDRIGVLDMLGIEASQAPVAKHEGARRGRGACDHRTS